MQPGDTTVVGPTKTERVIFWVGFPLLGAGAAWLLKALSGWIADLPWFPFQGLFRWLQSAPEPQATIGSLAVGAILGLFVAILAEEDYVVVTVNWQQLDIKHGKYKRTVPRATVDAAFVEGKRFSVLGRDSEELASASGDLDAKRLGAALTAHGYPWREGGDPHRDDYRRWVEDTPDLPGNVNAVFRARAASLEKDKTEDAADLRAELIKLGIVVRDEKKRQYWRRLQRPTAE